MKARDLPLEILDSLNRGEIASTTYVEMTAVDFQLLMNQIAPEISSSVTHSAFSLKGLRLGITSRMARAGHLLAKSRGKVGYFEFRNHPSDTVRGWAAYMLPHLWPRDLSSQLASVEPLAEDPHFGVREWAWLALRPDIASDIKASFKLLEPWAKHPSPLLRRFAIESTRPRGFWSKHIQELKERPALGLPLLNNVRSDPSRYVQLAVANWLNDTSKHQPQWVRQICSRWMKEMSNATAFIVRRAQRTLEKG